MAKAAAAKHLKVVTSPSTELAGLVDDWIAEARARGLSHTSTDVARATLTNKNNGLLAWCAERGMSTAAQLDQNVLDALNRYLLETLTALNRYLLETLTSLRTPTPFAGAQILLLLLRGLARRARFLTLGIKALPNHSGRCLKHLSYLGIRKSDQCETKTLLSLRGSCHAVQHREGRDPVRERSAARRTPASRLVGCRSFTARHHASLSSSKSPSVNQWVPPASTEHPAFRNFVMASCETRRK